MAKRRLEYRSDLSNKFWEIDVEGSTHTVCYGRIGSEGQTKSKDHGSPTRAHEAAEKLIAAKMKKGYVATPIGSKPVSKSTPKSADRSRAKRVCTVDAVYPEGAQNHLDRRVLVARDGEGRAMDDEHRATELGEARITP